MQGDNGSAEILIKIDGLLATDKISTTSALRILLESQQHAIKDRDEMRVEIDLLKNASWGVWTKTHQKQTILLVLAFLAFIVADDLRAPIYLWLKDNFKTIASLL